MDMNAYSLEFLADDVMFDPLSLCPEALFTQSDFYYRWQRLAGKEAKRFFVKDGSRIVAYAQCFFTPVRFLGGRGYWYAPYGPVCVADTDRSAIVSALKTVFAGLGGVFFRCDFFPALADGDSARLHSAPRFLLDGSIQPRSEWVLPLVKSDAELLAEMHSKARYSIQYAQRKEVSVRIVSESFGDHFETFCHLMRETSQRDGFVPHPDTYYRALFSELERTKQGFLAIGTYAGVAVSIALVIGYGKTATYVFGASSNAHRNVSAPALVQWQAALEAKRRGFVEYSFGGISSERFPMKTWQGITTFKQRFGGHEQHYSPIVDLVFQPTWYALFLVRKWAKRYLRL